ncbi:acyl-CoA dehydrogenase family protein [Flavivirga eckloniae]|uniref:Acyl-CoA dehydrogenase n=1 Tax=Flavivirga eckloniae TaxID=1803846 RepID=A0A2K9PKS0_9FLAO|nr:acyl-CoA dehydrogenase family protein [Flavivirga eckloniae]AUP77632.1 hypothetical protein C1H87_02425 [Flavivirga eckloniae]
MEILEQPKIDYSKLIHELGKSFAERAKVHDEEGSFVHRNYESLKAHNLFSVMIPKELNGGGATHSEVCELIKIMAGYCASTALAFAMHQHLIAASVWKYKHKGVGEAMLKNVVKHQLVLVSTGARDWLGSNGEMKKVDDGYLFSAKKHFASQSVVGDIAVTSAPFLNEQGEWKVLHFPVKLNTEGVSTLDDWDVMGMRGTGSQSLVFEEVFVPETAIALERDRDIFHPVWNVVLTVAMPLIMSVYVGIAEKAMEIAVTKGKTYQRNQEHIKYIIGKLYNKFIQAEMQWRAMLEIANDFEFTIDQDNSVDILSLKSNIADACIETVSEAMDAIGGQSFYKSVALERLFRDVQAAKFHPLPKWNQYAFTGEKLLNNS